MATGGLSALPPLGDAGTAARTVGGWGLAAVLRPPGLEDLDNEPSLFSSSRLVAAGPVGASI
jgi:hypothetical protein